MNIYYLFNLLIFFTNMLFVHKFLHVYQLKDYNNIRYFKYFNNLKGLFVLLCLILFIFELLIKNILFYIVVNIIFYILNLIYLKNLIKSKKTPLKFTKKLSRLYIISIFIILLLCIYKYAFLLIIIITVLLPVIANAINIYDKLKNKYYINLARKKLATHSVQIIAITGSNGKTSVKNILLQMLSTQYKTQATPASFNTPLGISKFINNDLEHDTQFLILEFGARHKKDIKKLCSLFGADFGIITTISPQHLESFKSIENIFKAKRELPNFLQNKPCIFNIDNLYTRRMYDEKVGHKFSVSIYQSASINAMDITIKDNKTQFNIVLNNKTYRIQTHLLGKHNVLNICLASTLATYLEITDKNIISTIESLQPVKHRLSLVQTHINILDDSYNCSPTSAKESLWVLQNFTGRKMVVTPGIIECGKEKYKINFDLGKQLSFCNYCVIVGEENKKAIFNGLKKAALEKPKPQIKTTILFAKNLEDAKQHFSKLNTGDTLLLLNDLPDDYK